MKRIVLAAAFVIPAVKVTHEFVGAPFTPPPTEIDQCITPEQANDPKQMAKGPNKDCDPADVKIDGNKK
ncbi:MAG TPA: hypothetical protein VHB97_22120 [Polyangia bacterium]|nr:hypothetical protein [Polyangia bacterium]